VHCQQRSLIYQHAGIYCIILYYITSALCSLRSQNLHARCARCCSFTVSVSLTVCSRHCSLSIQPFSDNSIDRVDFKLALSGTLSIV
jgi:hypothetical protein